MALSFACKKDPSLLSISNLNGGYIETIGHGGMGVNHAYPLNTLESIEKCLSLGADGFEVDIRITKDNKLIAFRSNDLADLTKCSGFVDLTNWSTIKNCIYKEPFFDQPNVYSLESLIKSTKQFKPFTLIIDCKLINYTNVTTAFTENLANALIQLVDKYELEDHVLIESDNENFLKLIKSLKPNYKIFINSKTFSRSLSIAENIGLYGIDLKNDIATQENIEIAHTKGFRVAIWGTITKRQNIAAIQKYPDYILTDKLRHLVSIF